MPVEQFPAPYAAQRCGTRGQGFVEAIATWFARPRMSGARIDLEKAFDLICVRIAERALEFAAVSCELRWAL